MDIVSSQKRSDMMKKVPQKDTSPEIFVRKALHSVGLRFRIHVKNLPGTPDIVLPKYKVAILVHGCFWHFHNECKLAKIPESNREEWRIKLERNVMRDREQIHQLQKLGWRVIIIWSCAIRKKLVFPIFEIAAWIKDEKRPEAYLEISHKNL